MIALHGWKTLWHVWLLSWSMGQGGSGNHWTSTFELILAKWEWVKPSLGCSWVANGIYVWICQMLLSLKGNSIMKLFSLDPGPCIAQDFWLVPAFFGVKHWSYQRQGYLAWLSVVFFPNVFLFVWLATCFDSVIGYGLVVWSINDAGLHHTTLAHQSQHVVHTFSCDLQHRCRGGFTNAAGCRTTAKGCQMLNFTHFYS